jgi:hypothetical protein
MLAEMLGGPGLIMRQKNSECCRCLCCQPNMEWIFTDFKEEFSQDDVAKFQTKMTAFETATCCGRCWSFKAPGFRGTKYNVYKGDLTPETTAGATVLFTHEKETTCGSNFLLYTGEEAGVRVPCCCCLPYLETKDTAGATLGVSRYVCDMFCFVPKFAIYQGADAKDVKAQPKYILMPETCLGGCCIKPNFGKKAKRCNIPFVIRDPNTRQPITGGEVRDLWAGWKKECCTKQNMYGIKYPDGADLALKATMMGAAMLVDLVVYEQGQ